jgi:hypothetical protein
MELIYPIVPRLRINRLVKLFAREKVPTQILGANQDSLALHLGLDFPTFEEEDIEALPGVVDGILTHAGFYFHPTEEMDREYGRNTKYYFYADNHHVWIATGDNCHGFSQGKNKPLGGRVLIHWSERLARSTTLTSLLQGDIPNYQDSKFDSSD